MLDESASDVPWESDMDSQSTVLIEDRWRKWLRSAQMLKGHPLVEVPHRFGGIPGCCSRRKNVPLTLRRETGDVLVCSEHGTDAARFLHQSALSESIRVLVGLQANPACVTVREDLSKVIKELEMIFNSRNHHQGVSPR